MKDDLKGSFASSIILYNLHHFPYEFFPLPSIILTLEPE